MDGATIVVGGTGYGVIADTVVIPGPMDTTGIMAAMVGAMVDTAGTLGATEAMVAVTAEAMVGITRDRGKLICRQ